MKQPMMVAAAVLLVSATATAQTDNCRCFTPNAEQIADLESRIMRLSEPIEHYARYYAGLVFPTAMYKGGAVIPLRIKVEFVPLKPGEQSAVHIVEGKLSPLQGDGCVANVGIAPVPQKVVQLLCAKPGGWTPGNEQIAELEANLMLPRGVAALDRYARHYAGVTVSGMRFIRGVYTNFPGTNPPGIYVASEVELPSIADGGCGIVSFQYFPETKEFARVSCNGPLPPPPR
jgi:hypothetical protein